MSDFDSLPVELQIHVMSYVGKTELKTARLMNRALRIAASVHLFSSVLVARRRKVLEALHSIASHPIYCKFVNEIRIDGSFYHPHLAKHKDVYHEVALHPDFTADHHNFSLRSPSLQRDAEYSSNVENDWEDAHELYKACYEEQEDLMTSHEDYNLIFESLRHLPAVTRMILLPRRAYLPVEKYFNGVGSTKLQRHERYTDHSRWRTTDEKTCNRECGTFWCVAQALERLDSRGVRYLSIGDKAPNHYLANAGLDVSHLDFDLVRIGSPMVLLHVFRHLTVLDLHLPCYFSTLLFLTKQFIRGKLSRLLSSIDNLEVFKLCLSYFSDAKRFENAFSTNSGIQRNTPTLEWIIGTRTWPKLRQLTIMHLDVHAFEIADLVSRHANSLELVDFSNVELLSGSWSDLVRRFVSMEKVPMMKLVMIYDDSLKPQHQPHDFNEGYWGLIQPQPDGTRLFQDTAAAPLFSRADRKSTLSVNGVVYQRCSPTGDEMQSEEHASSEAPDT